MADPLPQLVVSPEARQDLVAIYQYSTEQWGHAKADAYLEQLKKTFSDCQHHPYIGVERPDLFTSIRFIIVGSHNVYYRCKSKQIEIVRILHGRQDPKKHI